MRGKTKGVAPQSAFEHSPPALNRQIVRIKSKNKPGLVLEIAHRSVKQGEERVEWHPKSEIDHLADRLQIRVERLGKSLERVRDMIRVGSPQRHPCRSPA